MRVKAGIFSLTPPAPVDEDLDYLRWHLLDHMPEQFQLPGIQQAARYVADDALRTACLPSVADPLDVGGFVSYLVGDPVERTQADFMDLGQRLVDVGRFPYQRTSILLALLELLDWRASRSAEVSAEVLPWRPHRGVVLIVEQRASAPVGSWLDWLRHEHHDAVLDVPGVAGVWQFGSSRHWKLHPRLQSERNYASIIFVDGDLETTTAELVPILRERWRTEGPVQPRFAGPLRTMVEWEVWRQ